MELHLLSSLEEPYPAALAEITASLLQGIRNRQPVVAYLPAGAVQRHFIRETQAALRSLARVIAVKVEAHPPRRLQEALALADLLYIPGGNTYLMGQRLHAAGAMPLLRQRLQEGLPLLALSAGCVLCGLDILTTNDINCCGCVHFGGLGLAGMNFNVHYPGEDRALQQERDERLGEYQIFHPHPVLALEDGAYLRISAAPIPHDPGKNPASIPGDDRMALLHGAGWWLEPGRPKERLEADWSRVITGNPLNSP
jgi:peptidase E